MHWVLALPEPYRGECERDLARRRGRLSFEVVEGVDREECGALGEVCAQTGELFTAWGQAMADGELSAAEAQRILNETDDVIAAVLRLQRWVVERREREAAQR